MKTWLTDNIALKLFSLLLGVAFWYVVAREQGAEFAFAIPLELRDVPEGLEVVEESVQQVDVRLRGPAEILRRISAQDLSVAVDLSDAEPGQRFAYLTPEDVAVPFGARVMRVTPSSLQIELDRTMERTINVIPRILGAPAKGFELYDIALSPQEITVVGPGSRVRALDQVTTEPVSADGLRQPFSRAVRLELDPLIRLESGASVVLTLDVREIQLRKELAGVRVSARPETVTATLEPETVRVLVEGPRSTIEQLRAEDLEVEVRLDGLGAGIHKVVPIVHMVGTNELAAVHIVSVTPDELEAQDPIVAKLFGTDGIRGEAYAPPLDRTMVQRVGLALASGLSANGPRILIGRDTRKSGADIETWLATGIAAGGGAPVSAGVIPTPAVAFLTREHGFDAGVVISASHNPYTDNGIKIFSADGVKSSESLEEAIELFVDAAGDGIEESDVSETSNVHLEDQYLDHLRRSFGDDVSLPPLKLALDCANGAGYRLGPKLLEAIGLEPVLLATEPNGQNINRNCGSTHLANVAEAVRRHACDFGAALDGDGDRLLLVDSKGRPVNGDAMLLMCAKRLKKEDRLPGPGVVATVMSNMALEVSLAREDITLYRTQVGDKYVAQDMERRNIILGGEQSGHLIFSDYSATGDGLLTLMQVLRTIAIERESLDHLAHLEPFPQVLVNVRVDSRPDVRTIPDIARAIEAAESQLDGRGRVLIRYSGTEPLLRIMMEGPEVAEIESLTTTVRDAVESTIGSSRD